MAEAIGVVASLIAILQLTGTVLNTCYDYQSRIRNAPRDLDRISDQLIDLRTVLEQLHKLVKREGTMGSSRLSTLELLNTSDGPLVKCKVELTNLETKLKRKSGLKGIGQTLTWPLKERDVNKTIIHLEKIKALLGFALFADQLTLTLAIETGVNAVQTSVTAVQTSVIDVQTGVTDVKTGVTAVRTGVTAVQSDITALKRHIMQMALLIDQTNQDDDEDAEEKAGGEGYTERREGYNDEDNDMEDEDGQDREVVSDDDFPKRYEGNGNEEDEHRACEGHVDKDSGEEDQDRETANDEADPKGQEAQRDSDDDDDDDDDDVNTVDEEDEDSDSGEGNETDSDCWGDGNEDEELSDAGGYDSYD